MREILTTICITDFFFKYKVLATQLALLHVTNPMALRAPASGHRYLLQRKSIFVRFKWIQN